MSIVTRRGDDGNTDLWFADRVPKYHPQVQAYGALDEAKAALGLARSTAPEWLKPEILKIQKDLYLVSSDLATLRGKLGRLSERVGAEQVAWADAQVARYEKEIQITDWVISGIRPAAPRWTWRSPSSAGGSDGRSCCAMRATSTTPTCSSTSTASPTSSS